MNCILITGGSSGIGLALTEACLERGMKVRSLSRRLPDVSHPGLDALSLDLADPDDVEENFAPWLASGPAPEAVVLNAGILGQLGNLAEVPLEDLEQTMRVNTWANKLLLDALLAGETPPAQVVAISSGAATQALHGFAGYALSKAALNMLIGLYAVEFPKTHFTSLAPGIIATPMQEELSDMPDRASYATLQTLHETRLAGGMRSAEDLALDLLEAFPRLLKGPSGQFADLRE